MTPDFDALLAPLSAGHPSGEPLRYSGLYEAVEEARREDDPDLPQGVWKTDLKHADWEEAARLCREALETRGKDLQLAAWLLEAWIHLEGAPGAARGVALVTALCETFWDSVHPQPRDGDLEYRLAPLHWIEDRLPDAVRKIPVTRPESAEAPVYDTFDLQTARHLDKLARTSPRAAAEAEAAGRPTLPRLEVSVTLTPTLFYAGLAAGTRDALAALDGLAALLAGLCGDAAPGFQRFGDALYALHHFAVCVLEERREAGEEIPADPGGPAPGFLSEEDFEEGEGETHGLSAGGPIRSRAEAYRRLSEAADYLLRTEPHSPAPYLVKRAVAWGSLPLAELLRELLSKDSDLRTVYDLLGIQDRP